MMDARKDRIGEHAAEHAPPWAINTLGPVPGHPLDRLDWQRRAASIGAWRELSGHDDPADPIGSEPIAAAPDARAAWHEALAALGPVDGPDVRGLPNGRLLHLRDTYPIETAWAPPYVGDELRQVRTAAWHARLESLRADTEARAARQHSDHASADRKHGWPPATRPCTRSTGSARPSSPPPWLIAPTGSRPPASQRHLAIAADAELRRRHPEQRFPPLRSAEPEPPTDSPRDELTQTAEEARWASGSRTWLPRTDVRPQARRPAEPDHPLRRPRLW